jgi:hypothetical protein
MEINELPNRNKKGNMKYVSKKNNDSTVKLTKKFVNKIIWEPHNYIMKSEHTFPMGEYTSTRSLMKPTPGSTDFWARGCELSCWRMHLDFTMKRFRKFKISDSCLLRLTVLKRLDPTKGDSNWNWNGIPNLPLEEIFVNTSSPLGIATSLYCPDGLNKKFLVLKDIKMFMNSSQINALPRIPKKAEGWVNVDEAMITTFREGEIFCCVTIAPNGSDLKIVNFQLNLKLLWTPQYSSDYSPGRFELRY